MTRALVLAAALVAAPPHFSNAGQLLPLSPSVQAVMIRRHRSPHVYRLATVRNLTFFRFGDSGRCYGAMHDFRLADVTRASVPGVFGGYGCWSKPSSVMDFSIVGASKGQPKMHIERATGVASDQIRAIELVAEDGSVVATVPVRRNVYALWSVPRGAVGLRPVTRDGRRLPTIP